MQYLTNIDRDRSYTKDKDRMLQLSAERNKIINYDVSRTLGGKNYMNDTLERHEKGKWITFILQKEFPLHDAVERKIECFKGVQSMMKNG